MTSNTVSNGYYLFSFLLPGLGAFPVVLAGHCPQWTVPRAGWVGNRTERWILMAVMSHFQDSA